MRYRSHKDNNLSPIWIIIIINLLVFIGTIIYPKLILIFGLQTAIFASEPWTIVTNLFTHAGIWHILANMMTLYFFGNFLNRLLGTKKLLIIYFLGGIAGNIFYIFLDILMAPPSLVPAIGASGAVFALGGALTVLTPKLRVYVFPIPAPIPLWIAIIGGFFILALIPNVAWEAHLGGLVFGLIAGYFYRKKINLLSY